MNTNYSIALVVLGSALLNTLKSAAAGMNHRWVTRPPRYTTSWDELPIVR